jgi:hypothetical protein
LSRLATHFSIFYRTFSRREAVFHAKETGTNPEEVGITSELRPQLTTIPHKCQRNWPIPNDSREKTEIVHNSPQMPTKLANPRRFQQKHGNRPQLTTNVGKPQRKRANYRR